MVASLKSMDLGRELKKAVTAKIRGMIHGLNKRVGGWGWGWLQRGTGGLSPQKIGQSCGVPLISCTQTNHFGKEAHEDAQSVEHTASV